MSFTVENARAVCRGGAPGVISWCPTMDLVAIAAEGSTTVHVYRAGANWECVVSLRDTNAAATTAAQQKQQVGGGGDDHQHGHGHGHGHRHGGGEEEEQIEASVTSIAWRPDGKVLAVGRSGGTVALFSVETGDILFNPEIHRAGQRHRHGHGKGQHHHHQHSNDDAHQIPAGKLSEQAEEEDDPKRCRSIVCMAWFIHGGNSERRLDIPDVSGGATVSLDHHSGHGESGHQASTAAYAHVAIRDPIAAADRAGRGGRPKSTFSLRKMASSASVLIDRTDELLPPLPPLEAEHGRRLPSMVQHSRDSDVAVSNIPRLDIIAFGTDGGKVILSIQGTFVVASIDLVQQLPALENPVAEQLSLGADFKSLFVVVCAGHEGARSAHLVWFDVSGIFGEHCMKARATGMQFWRIAAVLHHVSHTVKVVRKAFISSTQALAAPFQKLEKWLSPIEGTGLADALDNFLIAGFAVDNGRASDTDNCYVSQFLGHTTSSALRKARKTALGCVEDFEKQAILHLRPACFHLASRIVALQEWVRLEEITQGEFLANSNLGESLETLFSAVEDLALKVERSFQDAVELRSRVDTLTAWLIIEKAVIGSDEPGHDTWPPPLLVIPNAPPPDHRIGLDTAQLHDFLSANIEYQQSVGTKPASSDQAPGDNASFAGMHFLGRYLREEGDDAFSTMLAAINGIVESATSSLCHTLTARVKLRSSACVANSGDILSSLCSPPAAWNVGAEQHVLFAEVDSANAVWLLRFRTDTNECDAYQLPQSSFAEGISQVKHLQVHSGHRVLVGYLNAEGAPKLCLATYEGTSTNTERFRVDDVVGQSKSTAAPSQGLSLLLALATQRKAPTMEIESERDLSSLIAEGERFDFEASMNRGLALVTDRTQKMILLDIENDEEEDEDDEEEDEDQSGDEEADQDGGDAGETDDADSDEDED